MQQHMNGRLTAATLESAGRSTVEAPQVGESLFLYVTDGEGYVTYDGNTQSVGQYDVILARPDMDTAVLTAASDSPLKWLSFYLPEFLR
jgi:hypothetical protein